MTSERPTPTECVAQLERACAEAASIDLTPSERVNLAHAEESARLIRAAYIDRKEPEVPGEAAVSDSIANHLTLGELGRVKGVLDQRIGEQLPLIRGLLEGDRKPADTERRDRRAMVTAFVHSYKREDNDGWHLTPDRAAKAAQEFLDASDALDAQGGSEA